MNVQRYRGGRGCRCPSSGIDLPSASLRGEPAARLRRARTRLHIAEHSSGGASAPSPIRCQLTNPSASAGALSLGGRGIPPPPYRQALALLPVLAALPGLGAEHEVPDRRGDAVAVAKVLEVVAHVVFAQALAEVRPGDEVVDVVV